MQSTNNVLAFERAHRETFVRETGRTPTAFESATRDALWAAYEAAQCPTNKTFQAVSSATGSGKTLGAAALLFSIYPATSAFVIKSLEECEAVFKLLDKLLPGQVAIHTSIHREDANASTLHEKKRELGLVPSRQFSEQEFCAAPIVICTHERWKHEILSNKDRGVRNCKGVPRALIIVDEDPELQQVFVKQPEDVDAFISMMSDTVLKDEARHFDLCDHHVAVPTLSVIHGRMRQQKDFVGTSPMINAQENLVDVDDLVVLSEITADDIVLRAKGTSQAERYENAKHMLETLEFLKQAAEGRVFYSRDAGGAFYAYSFSLPPQPRTIILDGTADINGMHKIGSSIHVVDAPKPNYGNLQLFYVKPPAEYRNAMKPNKLLKAEWNARPYLEWFYTFLIEHTKIGESILVYGKKALWAFGIHKQWDSSGNADPYYAEWEGRQVFFCHFGRGRGSNKWKDCSVYFRLGDFHQKKAVTICKMGSALRMNYSPEKLKKFSGRTNDSTYRRVSDSHLVVTNKQDAARIRIRQLDEQGCCPEARAYMVDCDFRVLQAYHQAMFPGSDNYTIIDCEPLEAVSKKYHGPQLLMELLHSTDEAMLTPQCIHRHAGISTANLAKYLKQSSIADAMEAGGWIKSTRKALGLEGKGTVLIRQ